MTPPPTIKFGRFRLAPAAAGALYCLVAVLGYGAANALMRYLKDCPTTWVICNKESITVLVVGPWLAWQVWRRKIDFPKGRPLAILVAAGLSTELIGNIGMQWGLRTVGLAVMVPADTTFVLVATAVLGAVLLGERVSARNAAVIGLLIVAVALLGYGTAQAAAERQEQHRAEQAQRGSGDAPLQSDNCRSGAALVPAYTSLSPAMVAAAIGVACACGTVFTLLSIALRYCVSASTSLSAACVIITFTGVATLGPISYYTAGPKLLTSMSVNQYALTYAAGVCNLVAFLALVRSLQLTTVMHANMISNAGQVSLAAIAGVLMFNEPCNRWLVLGVALMIAGIFAFGSPVNEEAVDAHV